MTLEGSHDTGRGDNGEQTADYGRCGRFVEGTRARGLASGGPLVLLNDFLLDSATRRHGNSLTDGPRADRLVLLPFGRRGATATGGPATGRRRSTYSAAALDERGERIAKLGGVLRREIDLVQMTIEPERHRLLSLATIEVVNESGDSFLGHLRPFLSSVPVL